MSAPAAVVYFRQAEGHLPPERVREEFAKLGRNDALWSALAQLVQQRLANAIVAASQNEPNAPGRLEELLDLQRELAGLRNDPATTKRPKVPTN